MYTYEYVSHMPGCGGAYNEGEEALWSVCGGTTAVLGIKEDQACVYTLHVLCAVS